MRTPAAHIPDLPGSLPQLEISPDVDAASVATKCLQYLDKLQPEHLTDDALWRDLFALTGTLRTVYSREAVIEAWTGFAASANPGAFTLVQESCQVMRMGKPPKYSWIVAMFKFEMEAQLPATGSGFLHLVPDERGGWRIWVIRTILEGFKGHGNVDYLPPNPIRQQIQYDTTFDAIVVGAGPHGLSTAGRLQAAGLSYLLIEKNSKIGDSWGNRYKSAKLHTPRDYGHLPFDRQYFADDDQSLGKETLSKGYQQWADRFDIQYWTGTNVQSAQWRDKIWSVDVIKDGAVSTLRTRNLILATGIGGQFPNMPDLPNREEFEGESMHSAQYSGPGDWTRKKGVVVGTANTAHDVAEDMLAAGCASVTMVQRGYTYVVPGECLVNAYKPMYTEDSSIELGDRITQTNPLSVTREMGNLAHHARIKEKKELYDGLEKVGFKLERFGDMNTCLYSRLGGHYIDVGTSQKIADGLIQMKSDAKLHKYTSNGLLFDDGSELKADIIVFATGFNQNMREIAAQIVGRGVADSMDDFWGVNSEGEIRGAWRPAGHPGLFYTGGTLGQSRMMTRFIALQIQAEKLGYPVG